MEWRICTPFLFSCSLAGSTDHGVAHLGLLGELDAEAEVGQLDRARRVDQDVVALPSEMGSRPLWNPVHQSL